MDEITLDEIMSGSGEAVPAATEEQQPEAGQLRDEQGRFAAKAEEPASVDQEQLAASETPTEQGKGVPVGAVQAEREKRQQAQAENETLRREMAELRGQVSLLSQQRQQPVSQPQQDPQPASLWDDPDAYLKSQMDPMQQSVQEMRETIWELQASQKHGADVVNAARTAAEALMGTPAGKALYSEITASGNPFDNLVNWHTRQQTLATVGNDPNAWLEAELEKRMADPAFQAQVIERARAGAVQNGNRQQPLTSIPPSLSRIPTGGNQADDGDASDAALFAHAMR